MGRKSIDLIGKVFGRLTVVSAVCTRNRQTIWLCQCECGTSAEVAGGSLRSGATRSCGCLNTEKLSERQKHGMAGTRIYRVWGGIITRCTNMNDASYKKYGGKGITICPEWLVFENFYRDMGEPEDPSQQIDRIDNSKGYAPGNCRWVTRVENARNKSNNVLIEHGGVLRTVAEWAELSPVSYKTFWNRLRMGWTMERALTQAGKF